MNNSEYTADGDRSAALEAALLGGSGQPLTAAYLLLLPRDRKPKFRSDGSEVRDWLLTLPAGCDGYPWDEDGEDGPQGRSVKSECESRVFSENG